MQQNKRSRETTELIHTQEVSGSSPFTRTKSLVHTNEAFLFVKHKKAAIRLDRGFLLFRLVTLCREWAGQFFEIEQFAGKRGDIGRGNVAAGAIVQSG